MSVSTVKPLWDLYAVPVAKLKQERYGRLLQMMGAEKLDALVVLTTAALGRKGNLRYITNYSPVSRYAGVVFPRRGNPVLLVPYAVHAAWAESISWIEDVRICDDFAAEIVAILHDVGSDSGCIGLDGEDSIPGFATRLAERLASAELVPVAASLAQLRLVTGKVELALARHAAAMADQVLAETVTLIGGGATEAEIFAAGEARLRRLHAEDSLLLIDSIGQQVTPFPTAKSIAVGDLVQYSVEPVSPGGHWIQSVRMFSRGKPTSLVQDVVQKCTQALAAAQAFIRPGIPIAEVAGRIADFLEPIAPQGRIPYGHGIGMDNFEPPLLSVTSKDVVQENMIIVMHPALVVEKQSFYLGDTYVATAEGGERLSTYPLDLIIV